MCVFLSTFLQHKVSTAALDAYHYAIDWKHQLTLLSNPCEDRIVKMTLERSKRILSVPVKKKEPMTVDILRKIVTFYSTLSLKVLRICTLCILGFSGFFRYSELSAIRMSDIKYSDSHVEINVKSSKADQYRQGQSVIISKTDTDLCPISWLNKYIAAAELQLNSDQFLFSMLKYLKNSDSYVVTDCPLSYTRAREIFHEALQAVEEEKSKFCLHSLRSGGVSAASNSSVEERLVMAHGRLRRVSSKEGYV